MKFDYTCTDSQTEVSGYRLDVCNSHLGLFTSKTSTICGLSQNSLTSSTDGEDDDENGDDDDIHV